MQKIHDTFKEICRANGWKCTPQRLHIYAEIRENYTHPQVDDVWNKVRRVLPSVSRESVYRILNEFTEAGLLQRLDQMESARYDAQTTPHGHFICRRCHAIEDFPLPSGFTIPEQFRGDEVRHVELRLTGLCAKCQAESRRKS